MCKLFTLNITLISSPSGSALTSASLRGTALELKNEQACKNKYTVKYYLQPYIRMLCNGLEAQQDPEQDLNTAYSHLSRMKTYIFQQKDALNIFKNKRSSSYVGEDKQI